MKEGTQPAARPAPPPTAPSDVATRATDGRTRVLLTVPHLKSTASPFNELMAIARHLPKGEFRLTVCSLRQDGHEETIPVLRDLGVEAFVSRLRPRGHRPRHLLASLRDQREIESHGPFDIQHSLDFTYSPIEALFARAAGRTFVFSQKNLVPGHGLLLRLKIRLAHRIVAISSPVEAFLFEKGAPPRKVEKIYLGIDAENGAGAEAAPAAPAHSRMILSVGQIVRRKRHEDAIRSFAEVAGEFPEVRLAIAGRTVEAEYESELRRLAADLHVEDRVDFLGVRKDVPRLMQAADCLLLCSEREALAWVLLEAMAAGLPVIASDVDGSSELIAHEESGFLAPVGDVGGFARALRDMLRSRDVRRAFAEQGRKKVAERFSARVMVEQLARMYRKLASGRPAER